MSKLVDELRADLGRPLTPAQKIERAFQAAETDEEREEIRAIATDEMRHAGSKDDVKALINAVEGETYEQEQDREQAADLHYLPLDPPRYEAQEAALRLDGLHRAVQEGSVSQAQYPQLLAQRTKELEEARERDAEKRAAYEQAMQNGHYDLAAHPKLQGATLLLDGQGSYDPETASVRAYRQGTPEADHVEQLMRHRQGVRERLFGEEAGAEALPDGKGFSDLLSDARSQGREAVKAVIRNYGPSAGMVLDDEPVTSD